MRKFGVNTKSLFILFYFKL